MNALVHRKPAGAVLGAVALAAWFGCVTPMDLAEQRYQQGDRLQAIELWRAIPPEDPDHAKAQERASQVEAEFEQLVLRYVQRGRYFEERGRLAESVLNYRLALRLQPDTETLDRVQRLVRVLAKRRNALHARLRERVEEGDLSGARGALQDLRHLDPFWAGATTDEQALEVAWRSEIERLLAKGRLGFEADDPAMAERAFLDVLALDASNESALGYLAYIERAREDGAEVVETASESEIRAEGFYRNALGVEARGDPYAAIALDLKALAADPEHEGARAHLRATRAHLARDVPGLLEAGRRHYQNEELHAALDQWRRALLVDPGNAQAREYANRAERLLETLERLRSAPTPPVSGGPEGSG